MLKEKELDQQQVIIKQVIEELIIDYKNINESNS